MAGKGDRYRPIDREKWEAGYARIFGKGRTVRRPCPHVDVDACVPCMECMIASIDWANHPQRELFDTVLKDLPRNGFERLDQYTGMDHLFLPKEKK